MANAFAVSGPNSKYAAPDAEPAGFWAGLWHGVISPVTFIVSLFNDDVAIYEVNNDGGWYDFGFLVGVGHVGQRRSKYDLSDWRMRSLTSISC